MHQLLQPHHCNAVHATCMHQPLEHLTVMQSLCRTCTAFTAAETVLNCSAFPAPAGISCCSHINAMQHAASMRQRPQQFRTTQHTHSMHQLFLQQSMMLHCSTCHQHATSCCNKALQCSACAAYAGLEPYCAAAHHHNSSHAASMHQLPDPCDCDAANAVHAAKTILYSRRQNTITVVQCIASTHHLLTITTAADALHTATAATIQESTQDATCCSQLRHW